VPNTILLIAAPSGLIMGYYANGGFYAQLSFCLLSTLWFYFTLLAFLSILKGKVKLHKNYMILSYALTLSVISLRLCKWIIVQSVTLPPMDTYRISSWLSWVFNLLIGLIIIHFNQVRKIKNPIKHS